MDRRIEIPKGIGRFQKTLQYARSKVDYVIGEFIYICFQVIRIYGLERLETKLTRYWCHHLASTLDGTNLTLFRLGRGGGGFCLAVLKRNFSIII